ncbi:MAG: helix-turn-helix transcriptional regulator [Bacteroidales bacterium]|nr:helix-turn-helix transcriptional regulator [Bacteroidales bacterium]
MNREELLKSPEYWISKIQIELFNELEQYMKKNNLNRTKLAEKLGVTKGYITQVLNGDFDHRLSKLVELSLAIGLVPNVKFEKVDDLIIQEQISCNKPANNKSLKAKTLNKPERSTFDCRKKNSLVSSRGLEPRTH